MSTENELTVTTGSITNSTAIDCIPTRRWRAEPDGPNDKQVDIWYRGKWVPAFFSDIKEGDCYLILDVNLEPTLCFYAASDCKRYVPPGNYRGSYGHPTFIIARGSEIVQAPAIKDVNTIAYEPPLLLKG